MKSKKNVNLDELLASVDKDRREFVKRVVVGTAFAAPVVTSLSMDALAAPNNPVCIYPNQTGAGCCQIAMDVASDIGELAEVTLAMPNPPTSFLNMAALGGLLAGALDAVTYGIVQSDGDCFSAKAKKEFTSATEYMVEYQSQLTPLGLNGTELEAMSTAILYSLNLMTAA